jgi:hypothetical protein
MPLEQVPGWDEAWALGIIDATGMLYVLGVISAEEFYV